MAAPIRPIARKPKEGGAAATSPSGAGGGGGGGGAGAGALTKKKSKKKSSRPGAQRDTPDAATLGPRSFIFARAHPPHLLKALVEDWKKVFSPSCASKLRALRRNTIRDFRAAASDLRVTHFHVFSASEGGTWLRLMRFPGGPTTTLRVLSYTTCREVVASSRSSTRGIAGNPFLYSHAPVLVRNGLSADVPLPITAAVELLQSALPPLVVETVRLSTCRRVLLCHRHVSSGLLDVRHYAIVARSASASAKAVRRLTAGGARAERTTRRLGGLTDVSELLTRPEVLSDVDSEVDAVTVTAPQPLSRSLPAAAATALRLVELGPRMTLEVSRVSDGFWGEGDVLYSAPSSVDVIAAAAAAAAVRGDGGGSGRGRLRVSSMSPSALGGGGAGGASAAAEASDGLGAGGGDRGGSAASGDDDDGGDADDNDSDDDDGGGDDASAGADDEKDGGGGDEDAVAAAAAAGERGAAGAVQGPVVGVAGMAEDEGSVDADDDAEAAGPAAAVFARRRAARAASVARAVGDRAIRGGGGVEGTVVSGGGRVAGSGGVGIRRTRDRTPSAAGGGDRLRVDDGDGDVGDGPGGVRLGGEGGSSGGSSGNNGRYAKVRRVG